MKILVLCLAVFCSLPLFAQKVEMLDSNTFQLGEGVVLSKTSFRGLSVVDNETIWVSGSMGTVARSTDGGKTFRYTQLKGYEKSDFRDIEAFDAHHAIVMSSGTPAYILKTSDGGKTWQEVYKNTDSACFLDAMDFWNEKKGVIVGDPINGRFVLLRTNDGGQSWEKVPEKRSPEAMEGEAVFAASGTSLRCLKGRKYGFVTGGTHARIILMKKKPIKAKQVPVRYGKSSQGIFSFAKADNFWLFAGGDYQNDTQTTYANFFYCGNLRYDSNTFLSAHENTNGYKSCIEVVNEHTYIRGWAPQIIVTGTSGTQWGYRSCTFLSVDFFFKTISAEPFHVVRKAKYGRAVFLAGPKGKIAKLVY